MKEDRESAFSMSKITQMNLSDSLAFTLESNNSYPERMEQVYSGCDNRYVKGKPSALCWGLLTENSGRRY